MDGRNFPEKGFRVYVEQANYINNSALASVYKKNILYNAIYFFLKKIRIGTPLKLNFDLSWFSR